MSALPAPWPARGTYAPGYAPVADCFAAHLRSGEEIGAALVVYRRGERVVDLWGGLADVERRTPWERHTRLVVFSVTKGLAAMALHLLADRGLLDWDAPVAHYWPGFARAGKGDLTVGTLVGHRGGLPYLDRRLRLADFCDPARREAVREALEAQAPAWTPGTRQGYHALTFGMYVGELFERAAGEPLGPFLRRELFAPLGSDAHLGTPPALDADHATLYPPSDRARIARMLGALATAPRSTEARVARATLAPGSIARRAFLNPSPGPRGLRAYAEPPARRAALAWAGATASADGIARAYLPFAAGGAHDGRRYLSERTLAPAYDRLGWSERDLVLQKPLGWSRGFLKEEPHLFSPTRESFGHAGIGGALGWCDPVAGLAWGYVMNRMDWRVRSPRAVALCRALYACEPVREALLPSAR
jgi:CubicO group peptidase (beta-lactamase class C family)